MAKNSWSSVYMTRGCKQINPTLQRAWLIRETNTVVVRIRVWLHLLQIPTALGSITFIKIFISAKSIWWNRILHLNQVRSVCRILAACLTSKHFSYESENIFFSGRESISENSRGSFKDLRQVNCICFGDFLICIWQVNIAAALLKLFISHGWVSFRQVEHTINISLELSKC